MSRGGFKITVEGQHEQVNYGNDTKLPGWLKEFASKAEKIVAAEHEKSAKTAVEVARERTSSPTIYEQMYAIMNGKRPLYSSVEEAVLDYQKKTGLAEHIREVQTKKLAMQIIAAGEEDENDVLEKKKV